MGTPGTWRRLRRGLASLVAGGAVLVAGLVPAAPAQGAPAAQPYAPVTIENCGVTTTYRQAPRRAVTLNQHATEVMLALGLEDRMVGTAYIDDKILPQYEAAYKKVPVLAQQYPSKEVLLNAQPDFAYAGFASAFNAQRIATRDELRTFGIDTYLTTAVCKTDRITMEDVYTDILNIGRIFGVEARARDYVDSIARDLQDVNDRLAPVIAERGTPAKVMVYDSQTEAPFVGACCGAGGMAVEMAGGKNIFDDLTGGWKAASWEAVVERDPDIIVLIEAEWSLAREKAQFLLTNEALSTVGAVSNVRFVTVPFTSTSPGIRNPALVRQLAVAIYPELFRER